MKKKTKRSKFKKIIRKFKKKQEKRIIRKHKKYARKIIKKIFPEKLVLRLIIRLSYDSPRGSNHDFDSKKYKDLNKDIIIYTDTLNREKDIQKQIDNFKALLESKYGTALSEMDIDVGIEEI